MAPRKRSGGREAQLAFEALSIEGGLLSPEWLAKVAQLQAGHQAETDYRIPKGLSLRDEIGRYWRIAQAHWRDFQVGLKPAAAAEAVKTATPESDAEAEDHRRALAERFTIGILREAFGFGSIAETEPVEIGGRVYPVRHRAIEGRVPVVIAPAGRGLETLDAAFGDGSRKRSAFGLAQELLNADENAAWGLAADGFTLRIMRDNASLTRPAWIEADLGRIFSEERYADFAALWLLAHETRFGGPGAPDRPVTDCPLENWRVAGREEGTRAREHLRNGVEEALVALGNGFLAHVDNQPLRKALHEGSLTRNAYFQELLRLVYRIIFLLTAEERGLLHPKPDEKSREGRSTEERTRLDQADEEIRKRYQVGYGLRRLRDRAVKRSAHDRFSDVWEGLGIVLRGVARGEPRLALPALGGIFAEDQCPHLDGAKIENRALLTAIFKLSWLREESGLSRVNWRDMGPEELGSVYESLLELVPQIVDHGRGFAFATGDETKGNARKTTGSYYTPDSLVQVLLDSALDPVIEATIAAHPENPAEALLQLTIVDPACGSGHFLMAAARRVAAQVARLQADGTPSAEQYRHALRQVVGRCLFGVDLNPMAVELCRVSLWMEAVEPGRPLSFLDSHIQLGNALLGATKELMEKGIPDAAWEPIEGDDRKTASLLKKRNKAAAEGQRGLDTLWSKTPETESAELVRAVARIEAAPDAELAQVDAKEKCWEAFQASAAFRHQKFVADAWCAAFVWPKPATEAKPDSSHKLTNPMVEGAPTNDLWTQLRDGQGKPPELTVKTVEELARQYHFFHWHLAFPQVFARGGFDIVLGNPPWERVKLQEQEFFASRNEAIASAANAAARKKLIAKLPEDDPQLWKDWCDASREAEGQSQLIRQSDRYPLCGKGDINTYAIFAEHNRSILGPKGRAGFIVPTGIATDDTTKEYFGDLLFSGKLRSLHDFQTSPETFGNLAHGALRFCLVTVAGESSTEPIVLSFFSKSGRDAGDPERCFSLVPSQFQLVNPNTRTCPTFGSARDARINLEIYRRTGVLWHEADEVHGNPWGLRFMAMFHMANDSGLFTRRTEIEQQRDLHLVGNVFRGECSRLLPLYEAKMVDHYDHRYASLVGVTAAANRASRKLVGWYSAIGEDPCECALPQYWVAEGEVSERLAGRWDRGWLLGWRDICRSTDQRTVIASLIPRVAVGHKLPLVMPDAEPRLAASLYGNLCSFSLDYAARRKVGGTSLTYFILKQLPVLAPSTYSADTAWSRGTPLVDWLLPRVLELTYTAWDLEPFAKDVGYDGPPFRWDPARRFLLRAELDAAFFHLYGISRDDTDYIMETFPIVRKNDEKEHGEYRTKRAILEVYDAMAEAIRTGVPYRTRLDPPPADKRVAHPASTRPKWLDEAKAAPARAARPAVAEKGEGKKKGKAARGSGKAKGAGKRGR